MRKKPKSPAFQLEKSFTGVPLAPTKAAVLQFPFYIHGQQIALPYAQDGFTIASPYDPAPLEVIDGTTWGEPLMEDSWPTPGVAARPKGIFIVLPDLCHAVTVTVVPDLDVSAQTQVAFQWFDHQGSLIDEKAFGNATSPIPMYKPFTFLMQARGIKTIGVYSNVETPICRVQALIV